MAIIKQDACKYGGLVRIEEGPGSWWTLYVDNEIKAQSADHEYILREYNNYVR